MSRVELNLPSQKKIDLPSCSNTVLFIREFLDKDYAELKNSLASLLKQYERKSRRLDKIIVQSDRQQRQLLELNHRLEEAYEELHMYKKELEEKRNYDIGQQQSAAAKINVNIVNNVASDFDLCVDTLFLPTDIMSGDIYSVFQKEDSSLFYYILDGQGHGITPSLTVFYAASLINGYIKQVNSLQELLDIAMPFIKNVLIDCEQLSFTFVWIDSHRKEMEYAIGGMYSTLLSVGGEIVRLKSNNPPLLSFDDEVYTDKIDIDGFEAILSYTDGLVETHEGGASKYAPTKIVNDEKVFEECIKNLYEYELEDDVTLIRVTKRLLPLNLPK